MNDTEARVLSEALYDLVEHPVVARDLAEQAIGRHHRRRRIGGITAAASLLLVVSGTAAAVGHVTRGSDTPQLSPAGPGQTSGTPQVNPLNSLPTTPDPPGTLRWGPSAWATPADRQTAPVSEAQALDVVRRVSGGDTLLLTHTPTATLMHYNKPAEGRVNELAWIIVFDGTSESSTSGHTFTKCTTVFVVDATTAAPVETFGRCPAR